MDKLNAILLVDDDKTTNFLNRLLLEDLAVANQVLVAENGREALQVVEQQDKAGACPTLILLDINMPVMSGFEFLEAYTRTDVSCKQSVVIIMLTTSLHPRDVNRLHEMPIQGMLNKPLTRQKIQDLLHQHFQRELPA
jgi:CheY-like chemotaxis protein